MSRLLRQMNESQKRAVTATEGKLLVLAGAGSGKTRVLTHRIAYLIEEKGIPPESILGLTFTNKAAAEMRERVAALVDGAVAKQIVLSTFHSFCMRILRREITQLGYTAAFTIYDENDVQRLVTTLARDQLEVEGEMPSLGPTLAVIREAKSKGLEPEQLLVGDKSWHAAFTRELYRRLGESMRAYNAVDFDSLLTLTVTLFEQFPPTLTRYQERYQYVMIDEYQDTNPIQNRLAELLTAVSGNLCVVGDDDQSIYGWRGADVNNILNFGATQTIKLEQNYRSTGMILSAANALIGHNTKRHGKALWSAGSDGEPIRLFHAPTAEQEAEAVICRLVQLREQHGYQWKDIAILYRSNALSRQFEHLLIHQGWEEHGYWRRGIPYRVYGGLSFYERREVKDLIAYLRVMANPKDEEALLRIINYPRRGVGDIALDAVTSYNRQQGLPLWEVLAALTDGDPSLVAVRQALTSRSIHGIEQFVAIIRASQERFGRDALDETIGWLLEKLNYKRAIQEEVKSDAMRQLKWENVEELVTATAGFDGDLNEFLNEIPLSGDFAHKQKKNRQDNCVSLLTFHSAKGLEFPACFLVGVEDHIIPHEKSLKETGIEEERRLFYVAITRAMKHLTISMAKSRKRMGKSSPSMPSRFLFEIPKVTLALERWDNI